MQIWLLLLNLHLQFEWLLCEKIIIINNSTHLSRHACLQVYYV